MDYPDGVYLIKGIKRHLIFICYARNGHRSSGMTIDKPVKEIYAGKWPYMSMEETTENYQPIYIGTEDFVNGMSLVVPNMTSKELLQTLDINLESKE